MEGSKELIKNNPPRELSMALDKLSENGTIDYLLKFVKKNGIQEKPYDLNDRDSSVVRVFIDKQFHNLTFNKDNGNDVILKSFKTLVDAGSLTPKILGETISNEIKSLMLLTPQEQKNFLKNTNSDNFYSVEFFEKFKKDFKEKTKQNFNWDISL